MERLTDTPAVGLDGASAVLAEAVLPQLDRASALIDRNPSSQTFGCADRDYWYYRTLTNFPGATWQQLMLALACVYRTEHPANPHHLNRDTASLVGAVLSFWARSQHRDGAFDEWYLNERSYCPAAITGAGAALTLFLMGDDLPRATRDLATAALERTARWLEPRYNADVMNQNLAAAAALQGLARLLPGSRWEGVARAKLERARRDQTPEGWFPEYGGMDFGYSTLALDLLAACSLLGSGPLADDMAGSLCRFLVEIRGAGFAAPGRLGSRGTSHAFPFGAIHFAASDANAAALAQSQLMGMTRRLAPRPENVDDRYFAYFYLPQFALALNRARAINVPIAPSPEPGGKSAFAASGLAVFRRGDWSVAVSRRLGAAAAVQTRNGPPVYHLGFEVRTQRGKRYASAAWEPGAQALPAVDGDVIDRVSRFRAVSSALPLRRLMIPFQLAIQVLVSSALAAAFQALVKRRMIAPQDALALRQERRIEVSADEVRIRDRLVPESGLGMLASIEPATVISMHSPSARQDPAQATHAPVAVLERARDLLNRGQPATLCWRWQASTAMATFALEDQDAP